MSYQTTADALERFGITNYAGTTIQAPKTTVADRVRQDIQDLEVRLEKKRALLVLLEKNPDIEQILNLLSY